MYKSILTKEKNIILTGMPGSGKTTIGKPFAKEIGYDFLDFDDDILEKISIETSEKVISLLNLSSHGIIPENISNKEVKDLLELLGDEDFLKLEGYIGENLIFNKPTVLSASGSLPLEIDAMAYLKVESDVVYIDTPIEIIIQRLTSMKTNRIVGMGKMTLEEILNYRKKYYDVMKDYNFIPPNTQDKKIIFNEFINFYKENKIGIN